MTSQFVPDSEDSMLSGYLNENLETTSGKRNREPSGTVLRNYTQTPNFLFINYTR
jgi:hypothetical protein